MTEREALIKLVRQVPDFEKLSFCQQVSIILWFAERICNKPNFTELDIGRCLNHLDLESPSLMDSHIRRCSDITEMPSTPASAGPNKVIKLATFRLKWRVRDALDKEFRKLLPAQQPSTVLLDLSDKIQNPEEKVFLDETIKCFRSGANRAAIVMCWNLTFSHLCNHILKHPKLPDFNNAIPQGKKPISTYEDFSRYKESDILDWAKTVDIVSKNQHAILKEKLDTRNRAAHPSTVIFTPIDTEHYITHLVSNLVLKL